MNFKSIICVFKMHKLDHREAVFENGRIKRTTVICSRCNQEFFIDFTTGDVKIY